MSTSKAVSANSYPRWTARCSALFNDLQSTGVGLCVIDFRQAIVMLTPQFASKIGQERDGLLGAKAARLHIAASLSIDGFARVIDLDGGDVSTRGTFVHKEAISNVHLSAKTFVDRNHTRFRLLTLLDIADFGTDREALIKTRRDLGAILRSL
jgi:hypothetical protein